MGRWSDCVRLGRGRCDRCGGRSHRIAGIRRVLGWSARSEPWRLHKRGCLCRRTRVWRELSQSPSRRHDCGRGAYIGGGIGGFFTNAASPMDLKGPFNTFSINLPFFSVQVGISGKTVIISAICGVPPCGIGTPSRSASTFPTNTWVPPYLSQPANPAHLTQSPTPADPASLAGPSSSGNPGGKLIEPPSPGDPGLWLPPSSPGDDDSGCPPDGDASGPGV
jgi:hypothetical protein